MNPAQAQKAYAQKVHQQKVSKLQRDILAAKEDYEKGRTTLEEYQKKLEEISTNYAAQLKYNRRAVEEIKKLDALETPEVIFLKSLTNYFQNAKQLSRLKYLISLNESLKSQESRFKQNCKTKLTEWKQAIESLRSQL